jgi:DNA-binding CsgD family transcriptional regulator
MRAAQSAQLIGRDVELDVLRAAAVEARAGSARIVLIEGEPGIGKTRLAAELIQELLDRSDLVISGHGIDLAGGELAYGVAAHLVRDVVYQLGADQVRDVLGAQAAALAPLHPALADQSPSDGRPVDRTAVFGAFHSLLLGLSRDRLLCLFIDDLQWVDASSLDLLDFVAKVSGRTRLLVLCTVRSSPSETEPIAKHLVDLGRLPGSQSLTLSALDDGQVAAVIHQALGDDPDPDLVKRVQRLSEGVPLYVEELMSAGDVELPTALRANLAARVAGLTDDELGYLQAAAVGVGHAYPDLVAKVSGLSPTAAALADREGTARGLFDPRRDSDPVRFHHDLLRQAVLDTLLSTDRQGLHRRWAEGLEAANPVDLSDAEVAAAVAAHWSEAGQPDRALPAAVAAAEAARLRSGFVEAAGWSRRALTLWGQASDPERIAGATRIDLVLDAMLSLYQVGDWQAPSTVARSELSTLPDDDWLTMLALRLVVAVTPAYGGWPAEQILAPETVEPTVHALLAEPASRLTVFCMPLLLQYRDCFPEDFSPELVAKLRAALAETPGAVEDHESQMRTVRAQGWLALERGDGDAALAAARAALSVEPRPNPMTLGWLIHCLTSVGRYQDAVTLGDRHGDLRSEPAPVLLWRQSMDNFTYALYAIGDWDRCWSLLTAMLRLLPPGANAATTRALVAQLAADRGELALAREQIDQLGELMPPGSRGSPLVSRVPPAVSAAHLALNEGDPEHALQVLSPVLAASDLADQSAVAFEAVLVAARALSRLTAAAPDSEQLVAEAAGRLHPLGELGKAWQAEVACRLADLRGEDDQEAWAEVVDAWRAVDFVYYRAGAQLEFARALIRSGDRDAAADELDDGLRAARALGAAPLVDEFRRLGRSARIRLEGEEASAATPAAVRRLTGRETEVLALIARGLTNQQIAAELFISPKTASVHVSRIITKLGLANRTEAAAYAHQHGLAE